MSESVSVLHINLYMEIGSKAKYSVSETTPGVRGEDREFQRENEYGHVWAANGRSDRNHAPYGQEGHGAAAGIPYVGECGGGTRRSFITRAPCR